MWFTDFAEKKAEKRVGELEERVAKLEREMHSLQLDWENTYDKVRQMMGRIAKRAEMLHDAAEADGKLAPVSEMPAGELPEGFPRTLTARQLAVQTQIANRRKLKVG